jgi:hypothetical protein
LFAAFADITAVFSDLSAWTSSFQIPDISGIFREKPARKEKTGEPVSKSINGASRKTDRFPAGLLYWSATNF